MFAHPLACEFSAHGVRCQVQRACEMMGSYVLKIFELWISLPASKSRSAFRLKSDIQKPVSYPPFYKLL